MILPSRATQLPLTFAVPPKVSAPHVVATRAVEPPPTPLTASAKMLPELQTTLAERALTWEQWYDHIAHAIYDHWRQIDAGPGTANVRVTIFSSRDVECQVRSFDPAPDIARDAVKETAFREAAVRAIDSVRPYEILDFPFLSQRKQATFDIDMRRSVNGPVGCEIVAVHDTELLKSAAP